MDNNKYQEILINILEPVLPGTEFSDLVPVESQRKSVSIYKGATELGIKTPDEKQRFFLNRSQPFSKPEKSFIEGLAHNLSSLNCLPNNKAELLSSNISSAAIAYALTDSNEDDVVITEIIDNLEIWSSETYEGNSISLSFVLDREKTGKTDIRFSDYAKNDFSKVLSNGYDTFVSVNKDGYVIGYDNSTITKANHKCPHRYNGVCRITDGNDKISFLLNRNGEILIFKSNELLFAKRRGAWTVFNHDTVVSKIAFGSKKFNQTLRENVYASALDVSFSRSGGCIAYFYKMHQKKGIKLIDENDLIHVPNNIKSHFMKNISSNVFQNIDRSLRQELLGIDGATVVDQDGNLIAVGSIVSVSPGSEEGGRSAATRELSKYGISLKISEDGKVSVYKDDQKKFSFA